MNRLLIVIIALLSCPVVFSQSPKYLFWDEQDWYFNSTIFRSAADGTNVEQVREIYSTIYDLGLDPIRNRLYWIDRSLIWRSSVDGIGLTPVISADILTEFAIDAGANLIYFFGGDLSDQMGLYRISGDAEGAHLEDAELVLETSGRSLVLDPIGRDLYWVGVATAGDAWVIRRASLDQLIVEDFLSVSAARPLAIDSVHRHLYWTVGGEPKIMKAHLTTGVTQELSVDGAGNLARLCVDPDARRLYWVDNPPGKIQSSDLDGQGIEDVVYSSLSNGPHHLAITSYSSFQVPTLSQMALIVFVALMALFGLIMHHKSLGKSS